MTASRMETKTNDAESGWRSGGKLVSVSFRSQTTRVTVAIDS